MVNERPINEEDKGLAKILSHCSGLATILNGELWIEVDEKDVPSESDGCTLHFTVHFQKSQQTYPQSGSRVLEAVRELPVLVVDDNVSNRNLLVNMLAGWGIQAHSAADGVSALELLHKRRLSGNQFWMVLLDASMPGMDGFTVAKQIVEHSGLAKFVLMMTSYDIEGDRASMCRDAGVHDQLHKPILPSELLEAFRYFIEVS
jgi:two-component system sensor histidine kinase/response regulator